MKQSKNRCGTTVGTINIEKPLCKLKSWICSLIVFIVLILSVNTLAFSQQYNVAGSAVAGGSPGCYTLTSTTGQSGAVWNVNTINLTQPADISLSLNFGCNDADNFPDPNCGADGMCFVLQPNGTGSYGSGGGVGFNGITPSFGIIMDTYENGPDDSLVFDNAVDHISININGDVWHGTTNELVPPSVGAGNGFPANIEDCNNHIFRFIWTPNPTGGTAVIYFDGVQVVSYNGDIVNTVFNGNPVVYWGVSASTGGCWNVQSVCMTVVAGFMSTGSFCAGSTVNFQDQSISGTTINSWNWNFGDGTTSALQNPTHSYALPGDYPVTLSITNIAGFTSTITQEITILAPDVSIDSLVPVCAGDPVILNGHAEPVPPTMNQITSFSNSTSVAIPDGGVSSSWTGTGSSFATSGIAVTGLTPGWDIESVCLDINHTYDGDLILYLKDPCGNLILLSNGNGGSGDNYTNTCFSPVATGSIATGFPPFSGTWIPDAGTAAWSILTGCATPNGTWSLLAGDTYSSDSGTLTGWSITFSNQVPVNIDYIWQPLNITDTLSPQITAASSGWYYLTAADALGCSATDSVYLLVNPVPALSVQNDTICPGEQASISVSGATSYLWNTTSSNNPLLVSPITTTSYSVTGTSAGCSASTTAQVLVNSSLNIALIGDTICEGETAILNPSGADFYLWNTSSTDDPYTVQPATTTSYTVTGSSLAGCSGSVSAQVMVNPNPVISIFAPSVCENTAGILTASGATDYQWSNGSTANPLTILPAITSTYSVTGTTLGCSGTDEATLVVNPLPDPSFSVTTNRGCAPLEIGFVNLSTGNITFWDWHTAGGTFSNAQNPTHVFAEAGNYSVILTATTDSGCTSSSAPVSIEVLDVLAKIIVNDHTYEAGDVVNFFDGSLGAEQWAWDFGNGMQSTQQNNNILYNNPGEYLVLLTVQNAEGCTNSDSVLIMINPLFTIYTPSAFSPNGDGINDTWHPSGESWNTDEFELSIFDRWGNMVFRTTDINSPWDGPDERDHKSAQSVYSYRLIILDINGIAHIREGSIMLVY